MDRRTLPALLLVAVAGCGGSGGQTTALSPNDPTMRNVGGTGNKPGDAGSKPSPGLNTPLGALKLLSEKSPLAKPVEGKVATDSAARLAKLGTESLVLDDGYSYFVAGTDAARVEAGGEKGASVPLPNEAKPNPDGSVWVVDGETRRAYTLVGVKREEGKPTTATGATSADLVKPNPEAPVPPFALAARAEEATTEVKHALRILAKGVGTEGAPETGARIRLRKNASDKGLPPLARSLMRSLKKYGATLAPGEGAPALTALSDPRWTKEDTKAVAGLKITDFEIVVPPAKTEKTVKKSGTPVPISSK